MYPRARYTGQLSAVISAASTPTMALSESRWPRLSAAARSALISATRPMPRKTSAGVKLQQRGAGLDLGDRRRAGVDAADADQREGAFGAHEGLRQHAGRQLEQRPARQPARFACALSRSRSAAGRATVVLPTIMPSTRCLRAMPTTSSSSDSVRSGAILSSTGVGPARGRTRSRASITRASSSSSALGLLQVAQARRVGRGDVDGEIAGDRGEGFDQPHIVLGAVGRIAVGADIDADNAALVRARAASRASAAGAPSLLKPSRLITPSSASSRNRRGRGLPACGTRGDGADLDEAEAEPQQRVRHLGVLVEAGGQPDRIGEIEPESAHRQLAAGPAAGRGSGIKRRALIARACASSGSRARISGRDRRSNRPITGGGSGVACGSDPIGAGRGLFKRKAAYETVAGRGRLKVIIPIYWTKSLMPIRPQRIDLPC